MSDDGSEGEPGSPSLRSRAAGSEGAPQPQGTAVSSQNLRQSSLWEAAGRVPPAGRGPGGRGGGLMGGRGRGRGGAGPPTDGEGPRFERLSALAMELDGYREQADGGGSSLFSDDEDTGRPSHARKPRRTRVDEYEDDDDDDDDDGDGLSVLAPSEVDGDDGVEAPRGAARKKKQKRPSAAAGDAAMIANAAFGGGGVYAGSDDESQSAMSSASSKKRRDAHKAAFPIKGVTCVGCALAHKIVPVEKFVIDNMHRMADDALWKFAALEYVMKVVEKGKREGAMCPEWGWKDIRTHFLLHSKDPRIARTNVVAQLQTMRHAVESRLIRNEGGERELDKGAAEMMLKIIKAESQERSLLQGNNSSATSGKGKGTGGSTVGDAGK